jgi:hypothetical protein
MEKVDLGKANCGLGKTSTEGNEGNEGEPVGGTPTGATGTIALPDWGTGRALNGGNRGVFKFLTVRLFIC